MTGGNNDVSYTGQTYGVGDSLADRLYAGLLAARRSKRITLTQV